MTPVIESSPADIYDIELEHSLLEANARLATRNREVLDTHGVTAIDILGPVGADLVVINKTDLAEIMGVRVSELALDAHVLKPDTPVLPASCKTGEGLDETAALLAPQKDTAHA